RILYVQEDVEEKMLEMLNGAMAELRLGNPWEIATDVGPVIDDEARENLLDYCSVMEAKGRLIAKLDAPGEGRFVAPHIFKVSGIGEMDREMFGPILHVATFAADELDKVIADINAKGYGLTFGLHTRIDARVQHIIDGIHAGNIYVNRNQIGSGVGSQPVSGEGLSGTGPKAGGPYYLHRFRKAAEVAGTVVHAPAVDPRSIADHMPDAVRSGWAARNDRIAILREHLRGKGAAAIAAAAAIEYGPADLPGPTGEANTLLLAPRGRVLCLGPAAGALCAPATPALAAGTAVLAVASGGPKILASLTGKGLPLEALDGSGEATDLRDIKVDVVAFGGDETSLRAVRRALAE